MDYHRLLMPPHPGDVYRQSALCSCGEWQWDGDSTVLDYKAVLRDHMKHVKNADYDAYHEEHEDFPHSTLDCYICEEEAQRREEGKVY